LPRGVPNHTELHLESRTAAELELLDPVELPLGEGNGIVEAQRTEWRGPDQTDTDRGADDIAAIIDQTSTGAGIGRNDARQGRLYAVRVGGRRDFAGVGPRRRSLVVPEITSVGIDRALKTHFPGQEPERH